MFFTLLFIFNEYFNSKIDNINLQQGYLSETQEILISFPIEHLNIQGTEN